MVYLNKKDKLWQNILITSIIITIYFKTGKQSAWSPKQSTWSG